ncbi:MAG: ribonuclease [Betaproteobacteria bacterium]|jgi:ribonuclease T1
MRSKTLDFAALAVCWGLLFAPCTNLVQAKSVAEAVVVAPIALQDLPKEGQETYLLIRQGGPFRYEKDGVVFGNRERQLPQAKRGFYREYTVKTPGEKSRGARRIVCGGEELRVPKHCFYTQDHYTSFREIVNVP